MIWFDMQKILIYDIVLIKRLKIICVFEKKVVILQPDLLCGGVYICVAHDID